MYFMLTACGLPQGGMGVRLMWTGGGGQNLNLKMFVDVINGWPLMDDSMSRILGRIKQVDLLCADLLESHCDRFQVSQK